MEPHVDFQGVVAVSAHDHFYTSTHAHLKLKMHFDLYQHYWDGRETYTIIDENRHSSHAAYRADEHRVFSKSLGVSAGDIVWIKLTMELDGEGRSDHARVDCDFRTGADNRIRVEHIRIRMT
ncbi:hypothetical protein GCM10010420_15040 [Streptomyces glaucosporus]|uniref:Uncharacterized protein n=1 Tax=Streptomyces glaucosporus TaxID=284044 RepID=A0ABN3I0Y9_9ACTN